ncbi:MAG: iron export ABC transporter permease subunit FetB [Nostocaceae cyanobacterium]|nr:iron export ABC transporter permease subunit FetB [Nostocaceae cyanobacterium]
MEIIQLDLIDLAIAVGLIIIAIGLSAWQQLGLEWNLTRATGQAILQLLFLGYFLELIFSLNESGKLLGVLGFFIAMLTITSIVTRNRISQKIPWVLPVVWGSIFISTAITVLYTNFLIIQPEKWYEPRYLIPLAGIVLGSAMNSAAIAGERLVNSINDRQLEIETHLSLGATPAQAIAKYRKEAIRFAVLPILNQMMIVGLGTLPVLTSGQILGGVTPLNAVAYEIVIIIMLAFANLLTTLLITHGLWRQFFNYSDQLIR